jgi:hypothetical protein
MDGQGFYPWHTQPDDGGTYGPWAGDGWRNYLAASNQLGAPKLLVCPSDAATLTTAIDWSDGVGGFANPAIQNKGLSYFTGLDAFETFGITLIAGDRNIGGAQSNACKSVSLQGVRALDLKPPTGSVTWTNSIHRFQGNLAVSDGSVQRTRQTEFNQMVLEAYRVLTSGDIRTSQGTRPDIHVLPPR